jgi:hypothetical protein
MIKKLRNQPYAQKWEQAPKGEQRGRRRREDKLIITCATTVRKFLGIHSKHRTFAVFVTVNIQFFGTKCVRTIALSIIIQNFTPWFHGFASY